MRDHFRALRVLAEAFGWSHLHRWLLQRGTVTLPGVPSHRGRPLWLWIRHPHAVYAFWDGHNDGVIW